MRISISWLERTIACCLATLLATPLTMAATTPLPSAPLPQVAQPQSTPQGSEGQSTSAAQSQSTPAQQTPAPVGTAVAPYIRPAGVTASRPAGAAIAPAKQRRVHIFTIRLALIVGAAVAVGAVAAASMGSPSRPH